MPFNMKGYLLVLLIVVVGGIGANMPHLSQTQKEKAQEFKLQCVKESSVKPELLANVKKGQFSDDENLKKFIFCFFKKAGIVTSDAKLNIDVALAKLPEGVDKAEAAKLLKECQSKTGKNEADTAYEILKCYFHGTKSHIDF